MKNSPRFYSETLHGIRHNYHRNASILPLGNVHELATLFPEHSFTITYGNLLKFLKKISRKFPTGFFNCCREKSSKNQKPFQTSSKNSFGILGRTHSTFQRKISQLQREFNQNYSGNSFRVPVDIFKNISGNCSKILVEFLHNFSRFLLKILTRILVGLQLQLCRIQRKFLLNSDANSHWIPV